MLGRMAMLQYRWDEAIGLFDRVLRVRVDPWTLANLGNCYWKTGDLDQAEYCLRGALELEPALTAARVGLATVLHARQLFDRGVEGTRHRRGVAATRDYQVNSRRGCTLARLERYDEAQAAFELAAEQAGKFVYPRLVAFDRATWDAVRAGARGAARAAARVCRPPARKRPQRPRHADLLQPAVCAQVRPAVPALVCRTRAGRRHAASAYLRSGRHHRRRGARGGRPLRAGEFRRHHRAESVSGGTAAPAQGLVRLRTPRAHGALARRITRGRC